MDSSDKLAAIIICFLILVLGGLAFRAAGCSEREAAENASTRDQQQIWDSVKAHEQQESLRACMAAGGPPLECRAAVL